MAWVTHMGKTVLWDTLYFIHLDLSEIISGWQDPGCLVTLPSTKQKLCPVTLASFYFKGVCSKMSYLRRPRSHPPTCCSSRRTVSRRGS